MPMGGDYQVFRIDCECGAPERSVPVQPHRINWRHAKSRNQSCEICGRVLDFEFRWAPNAPEE
jgi:hypothetical protein